MKPFSQIKTTALATLALGLVSINAQAVSPPTPPQPNVASQEEIRDIRPPIHIAPPFPWFAWTGGTVGVAALGFAFWKLLLQNRRKQAFEIALERLENTRALMRETDAEPFCLAVSEIVRAFVEETLPVRAMHRTTDEFLRDLASLSVPVRAMHRTADEFLCDLASLSYGLLAPHRGTFANFLHHCDLAKFARWSLTVPQMEALLANAKELVIDLGKPSPAESPKSAAKPMLVTA
jgi:hypothetical protein